MRTPNRIPECIPPLLRAGIGREDAYTLRRVAMTLQRWFELECGTENGGIERDETTGKPYWTYEAHGAGKRSRYPIADREAGAMRRLKAVMAKYPGLGYYVQGDPRGASLYILRSGDVPEGCNPDAYYNRGLAVYK